MVLFSDGLFDLNAVLFLEVEPLLLTVSEFLEGVLLSLMAVLFAVVFLLLTVFILLLFTLFVLVAFTTVFLDGATDLPLTRELLLF